MAVTLGARRGELAALRWTDIDLDRGVVNIRRAIVNSDERGSGQRRGARVAVKDTKTHAERTVAVDPATVQALRKMRSRHVDDGLACGLAYPADAYLWRASPDGTTPRPPDRFSYDWAQIDKAVDDGAHVRLHDLRHFHGTMLVGAGVPLPSARPPRRLERHGHRRLCRRSD